MPGVLGQYFPSVCSFSSYLGLCQQQSSPEIRRVWFPLTTVSCFHIVSVGLRDVAFGQVQQVQALQNPSSPPVAAIKGHSLNQCQLLQLQLSGKKPKSAECLLVQDGSWKVLTARRILREVRSDLIVSKFLNHCWVVFFFSKRIFTW